MDVLCPILPFCLARNNQEVGVETDVDTVEVTVLHALDGGVFYRHRVSGARLADDLGDEAVLRVSLAPGHEALQLVLLLAIDPDPQRLSAIDLAGGGESLIDVEFVEAQDLPDVADGVELRMFAIAPDQAGGVAAHLTVEDVSGAQQARGRLHTAMPGDAVEQSDLPGTQSRVTGKFFELFQPPSPQTDPADDVEAEEDRQTGPEQVPHRLTEQRRLGAARSQQRQDVTDLVPVHGGPGSQVIGR